MGVVQYRWMSMKKTIQNNSEVGQQCQREKTVRLFTIGHSNCPFENFLSLLKEYTGRNDELPNAGLRSPGFRSYADHMTTNEHRSDIDCQLRSFGGTMECGFVCVRVCVKSKSGRADSNRRRSAWEADILPLNYARKFRDFTHLQIRIIPH